jgi:hypothetical protein
MSNHGSTRRLLEILQDLRPALKPFGADGAPVTVSGVEWRIGCTSTGFFASRGTSRQNTKLFKVELGRVLSTTNLRSGDEVERYKNTYLGASHADVTEFLEAAGELAKQTRVI